MSRELIQKIFSLDKGIRYVAILNQRGEHLEGGLKPGLKSLNPEQEEQRLFLQTAVSRGMSESWRNYFDEFKFSIVAHKRVTVFQFPFGTNVLLVTAEPRVAITIAEDICKAMKRASLYAGR
jgi:hypothetical protein